MITTTTTKKVNLNVRVTAVIYFIPIKELGHLERSVHDSGRAKHD